MELGVIRTIKKDRGFGFIRRAKDNNGDAQADIFFHAANCNLQFEEWKPGDKVKFDVAQGRKGPEAMNVVLDTF